MTPAYTVYVRVEVYEFVRKCGREEQRNVVDLLKALEMNPFLAGDYQEKDEAGRKLDIKLCGRLAIIYYVDHAVKEIKVIESEYADK